MILWILSVGCLISGLRLLLQSPIRTGFGGVGHSHFKTQRKGLLLVGHRIQEIEEILLTGQIPSYETWNSLQFLPEPWATLSSESVKNLRSSGGALLPTLRRFRNLAEEQVENLMMAQAKSSQAFAQVFICMGLVPLFGSALYLVLPSIQNQLKSWLAAMGAALILTGIGAVWLFRLTDKARWGGLTPVRRSWILCAQIAGERFLSLVRSGTPPDLAWAKMIQGIVQNEPDLAQAWGISFWEATSIQSFFGPMEKSIVHTGDSIKKAIQVSLMEGRPCLERIETVLYSLRTEMKAHIEKELSLLGTTVLKPLFVCIAPAIIGLLIYGMILTFRESQSGGSLEIF